MIPPCTCRPFQKKRPRVHPTVFVADGARIVGDVHIGAHSSVWFNSVLRADVARIRIGQATNIQDLSLIHVDHGAPCAVGDEVVVGHHVCLHACTVGDGALIGIGAIVLSGARIGEGALVAAGALVPGGVRVPARTLVMGVPARPVRKVTATEQREHRQAAQLYVELAKAHRRKKA